MYKTKEAPEDLSVKELERAAKKYLQTYQIQNHHRITAGRDHWEWSAKGDRRAFILKNTRGRPPAYMSLLLSDNTKGTPVEAFIQDGRWVARCECMGQEVVDPQDPLFVCLNPSCYNVSSGHYPRAVNFPTKQERKKLAEVLLARTNPINRTWDRTGLYGKPETIEDLERENKKHGLKKAKVEEVK